jgi:hypothetical protein
MVRMKCVVGALFLGVLGYLNQTVPGYSQSAPDRAGAEQIRDGQHDFDFNFGTWKTHIMRLQNPLSGSKEWIEMNGTVTVRKIWGGKGQLEEIEADAAAGQGSGGHFEGLTLFLYNPQSHQWSQDFASNRDGSLGQPMIGEFKDGRGELISQETFKGRTILVRGVWSDIKADSHQFEQAFSDDCGKTWEANFVASLTREK